jgi:D-lyxose ketol-isomerase
MRKSSMLDRREACVGMLGCVGGLWVMGQSQGAEQAKKPRSAQPVRIEAPSLQPLDGESPEMPDWKNEMFYDADGKFQELVAKKAYLDLCEKLGCPPSDNLRENLAVSDFALGRFAEVGLGYLIWVNELEANYASIEIVLLPGQMIPEHWHIALDDQNVTPKMESWIVRGGSTYTYGEGEPTQPISVTIPDCQKEFTTVMRETLLRPGEVTGITKPLEKHWQLAGPRGCVLTEVSTYHSGAAVRFNDPKIAF